MVLSTIANWALRAAQALFGIVILGLSVTLIRGHHWGSLPSSLGYSAFVGGITILAALIGVAGTFVSLLEGLVGMAIDVVVAIASIVGGIVLVIKLKGVNCKLNMDNLSNAADLALNELFNGGCHDAKSGMCWINVQPWSDNKMIKSLEGHCRESKADMVFMFITGGLFLVTALLIFLKQRRG
ncbi:marvel domain-containing protein [Phaeosphaeria sp. MPI-PUGE-AT-0046c]|nr:marvel domain-containing protein [Phaeosphaeria sp. MPI-PUGE-AT-0046c]